MHYIVFIQTFIRADNSFLIIFLEWKLQVPLFKSKLVKYFACPSAADISSVTGSGHLDL